MYILVCICLMLGKTKYIKLREIKMSCQESIEDHGSKPSTGAIHELDGQQMTAEEFRAAKAASLNEDSRKTPEPLVPEASKPAQAQQSVVRACLPGPTMPLDSHPDNVKAYMVKWNMCPKNGPEVMAALGASPSVATPAVVQQGPQAEPPVATPAVQQVPQPEPPVATRAAQPEPAAVPPVATPAVQQEPPAVPPVTTPAVVQQEPPRPVVQQEPPAVPLVAPSAVPETLAADGGMAEMEQLVLASKQQPVATPRPAAPQNVPDSINWSSHRKEGMRLTRLMDSNQDRFPHMLKMWNGSKKDHKL